MTKQWPRKIIELQAQVLGAFRKLVPPGERLVVVDPEGHHAPLLLDPHVPFEAGVSRDDLPSLRLLQRFERMNHPV
jgi:hypothetical protein